MRNNTKIILICSFSSLISLYFFLLCSCRVSSSSSSSSSFLLQGTMHPISSSLVKHTQCAALIPFYNQDTQQCYRDVTFLMHHLRWLAWNASSQGYVVSCRHARLFYIYKKEFMHSLYLDCHALLWPMSQSLTQPWEGGAGTVNVDDDCIFLVVFLVIFTKPTFSLSFLNFVVSPISHMSSISVSQSPFPSGPCSFAYWYPPPSLRHSMPPQAFTSLHQDHPVLL